MEGIHRSHRVKTSSCNDHDNSDSKKSDAGRLGNRAVHGENLGSGFDIPAAVVIRHGERNRIDVGQDEVSRVTCPLKHSPRDMREYRHRGRHQERQVGHDQEATQCGTDYREAACG